MYNFGVIGNCQINALVKTDTSLQWLCLPRPDSPPVFGKLLDEDGGHFTFAVSSLKTSQQHYLPNTNILVTDVTLGDNSKFRVTDFCPRFEQYNRMFRPNAIVRIIEPLAGTPLIKVDYSPVNGWSKQPLPVSRGNSHFRSEFENDSLRLSTNAPMIKVVEKQEFYLKEKTYFYLSWGLPLHDDLAELCEKFLNRTIHYWQKWVKHCNVPSQFQKEVIRSALALKLHCFEETGAILASLTNSLPEELGHTRNWDYRFCWLRDTYFSLSAFHNLGHFEETEAFIQFLLNLAENDLSKTGTLHPVYKLDHKLPLPELTLSNWTGFANSSPVRVGNQAAEHIQNDVYGEMILSLTPIYLDERFVQLRNPEVFQILDYLGKACIETVGKPDAGLWEIRENWIPHTFTHLMSWAGLERLQAIEKTVQQDFSFSIESSLKNLIKLLIPKSGFLTNGFKDQTLDASLLLAPILRFPKTEINIATVAAVRKELQYREDNPLGAFLYRYKRQDDFGAPGSAFLICSFWLSQALARLGQINEARAILNETLHAMNHVGLFAEHFAPSTRTQLGNFPQAYSHVGLINAAFEVSPPWTSIL